MKKSRKILYIVVAVLNAVSLLTMILLTIYGKSLAESQGYNYTAEKWDETGGYKQISCFLTDDSGFSTETVGGVKAEIISSLKNISIIPESGKKFIPESYSTSAGKTTVRSYTTNGRSEAELTAAGGDFFMFRNFTLISGAYFSDSDIMQDGAVIDRSLAWALYGSDDIAGMNIYINGVKFYISGVIENPQTEQEKETAGEYPQIYVSYEGMNLINMDGGNFSKVSCYECIVPDPVKNYAFNAVNGYFESSFKGKYEIVNNTTRFDPTTRAKSFKDAELYAVRENGVIFPYWENASRIVEFRLTFLYFYRRFTYVVPVLTVVYIVILLWKLAGRLRRSVTEWTGDRITRIIYNHNERKRLEEEKK